jgi:hypothetical protein
MKFFFYDFDFVPLFKEHVLKLYNQQLIPPGPSHVFAKQYPKLRDVVNYELKAKRLPLFEHLHFINWPASSLDATAIHVDGSYGSNGPKHAAYNIPIFGSSGVNYEWFAEPYQFEEKQVTMPNGRVLTKQIPVFPHQPIVSESVSVSGNLFLCTHIPHRATLSKEKRLIISLRFEGNWTVSQFKTAVEREDIHG